MTGATAAMRPSRIDTSPSTMSNRSFIVTTTPLRMSRDTGAVGAVTREVSGSSRPGQSGLPDSLQARRRPLHRQVRGVAVAELAVLHGDQLRQDADGDLLRCDRADVQADRRMHALQALAGDAVLLQRVVDAGDLRAAADQAEIPEVPRREGAQRLEIVGVAARDDDDVGVRRQLGSRDPGRDVFGDDLARIRKALAVGELLAIVDDVDLKADRVRQGGELRCRRGRRRSRTARETARSARCRRPSVRRRPARSPGRSRRTDS